jgi:hypothetical protein
MYDFYMYLKHIEHSSENLEFYIWYKNYEEGRLTGNLSRPQTKASTQHNFVHTPSSQQSFVEIDEKSINSSETQEDMNAADGKTCSPSLYFPSNRTDFPIADFYAQISSLVSTNCGTSCKPSNRISGVFGAKNTPPSPTEFESSLKDGVEVTCRDLSTLVSDQELARRSELETIRTLFLLPGAPKELNIPSTMRNKVLEAISSSTSAANLKPIADHCYLLLKSCSHRNFIRLGVSNGTFETICMATGLGIVLVATGLLAMFLLAFASPSIHHGDRWRAVGLWPMWATGVGLILSGLRGSCFFLLLFSRRQPLPWEKFEDDASFFTKKSGLMRFFSQLMIFDRKLRVKDDNLRYLQRKIVMQSIFGGMVFATLLEVFFLSLPIWKAT